MSVRGRHAALLVVALVVGFQVPGLGRDWLLSDASALRGNALWREDFATVWSGTTDYARYFAPWAGFVQRSLRAGTLPLGCDGRVRHLSVNTHHLGPVVR